MKFRVKTKGHYDVIDITDKVQRMVDDSGVINGVVVIFVPGSTAAMTTIEYESGVIQDFINVLEKIAPEDFDYVHHSRWGDRNGGAHIKAALIGPDLNIPIEDGKLVLGTWQQVVLIDFDERPREREVMIKVMVD